jgi:hypothetical protein
MNTKKTVRLVLLLVLLTSVVSALKSYAADVTGTWKADIESPVGILKYTYLFKQEGSIVTGKIIIDMNGEKHETDMIDGKLQGDTLTFIENVSFDGNEFRINYSGKVTGDEINFTRVIGDFGNDAFVAKREGSENQANAAPAPPRRPMQPNVLGPDDKAAFAAAPEGFDKVREQIDHGKIETVGYASKTVGTIRKMMIYTPPGYSPDNRHNRSSGTRISLLHLNSRRSVGG